MFFEKLSDQKFNGKTVTKNPEAFTQNLLRNSRTAIEHPKL